MKKAIINYVARTMWQLSFVSIILMGLIALGLPEVESAIGCVAVVLAWYFLGRVSFIRFFYVWPEKFMGITKSAE